MSNNKSWPKQWSILASKDAGGKLIPEGAQFSLEPEPATGDPVYYRLRAGTLMDRSLDGRPFYPVGVKDLDAGKLPKWSEDATVRQKYMTAAESVKGTGRKDPLATRLEGTFTAGGTRHVARIYHFPNAREDGRHWSVLDIVSPSGSAPASALESGGGGTGHGDG
jgi:hypothetical protein